MTATGYSDWVGRQSSRSGVISGWLLTHLRTVLAEVPIWGLGYSFTV